jgi:uncharacterized heparinase superfamily protein
MRGGRDFVFFSCAPLGLSGRGGHSHNDVLSFEALLDGYPLIADPGCFVYTASCETRNAFRSTRVHNTPQVDAQEINRFVSPRSLWRLRNDARPEIRAWDDTPDRTLVTASHDGYERLTPPVVVVRTLILDKVRHALSWRDTLEPDEGQALRVPLQLDVGVRAAIEASRVLLQSGEACFELRWSGPEGWNLTLERGVVSPQYGTAVEAPRLVWARAAGIRGGIGVELEPCTQAIGVDPAFSSRAPDLAAHP